MKVALDATAVTNEPSGARTRLLSLYSRVARMQGVELTVVVRSDAGIGIPFEEAGASVIRVKSGPAPWARCIKGLHGPARRADRPGRFDLFAAETLPLPKLRRVPMVVTVHDLRFLRKKLTSLSRRFFTAVFMARNLLRARVIITPSTSIMKEMQKAFPGLKNGRIQVVHNGIPPLEEVDDAQTESILEKLGVRVPFFLYLGHLERRKNVDALVEGFHIFRRDRSENMAVALVIAGAGGEGTGRGLTELWKDREGRPERPGLHVLGPVSDEERGALLRSALLAVQPALYEGFGMGVLEAMACGIPVACSGIDAHLEVAGEKGALFFNPHSAEEIANVMARGAMDSSLRGELIEKGKERARAFSWKGSAEKLVEAWTGVVGAF